jgi:hypothetical protein
MPKINLVSSFMALISGLQQNQQPEKSPLSHAMPCHYLTVEDWILDFNIDVADVQKNGCVHLPDKHS